MPTLTPCTAFSCRFDLMLLVLFALWIFLASFFLYASACVLEHDQFSGSLSAVILSSPMTMMSMFSAQFLFLSSLYLAQFSVRQSCSSGLYECGVVVLMLLQLCCAAVVCARSRVVGLIWVLVSFTQTHDFHCHYFFCNLSVVFFSCFFTIGYVTLLGQPSHLACRFIPLRITSLLAGITYVCWQACPVHAYLSRVASLWFFSSLLSSSSMLCIPLSSPSHDWHPPALVPQFLQISCGWLQFYSLVSCFFFSPPLCRAVPFSVLCKYCTVHVCIFLESTGSWQFLSFCFVYLFFLSSFFLAISHCLFSMCLLFPLFSLTVVCKIMCCKERPLKKRKIYHKRRCVCIGVCLSFSSSQGLVDFVMVPVCEQHRGMPFSSYWSAGSACSFLAENMFTWSKLHASHTRINSWKRNRNKLDLCQVLVVFFFLKEKIDRFVSTWQINASQSCWQKEIPSRNEDKM